ncbi:type IV secretory system conjugative DNA transfer family protein [Sulfurimonas sp. NWX79]|uniref:type IV secretory system conjugative DNA transfer family protein n=1 Tax=Sulfurimonas sp. NWX79 TaxID=2925412 RepID=UPI003204A09D
MEQLFALLLFTIVMYVIIINFFKRFLGLSQQSEQLIILSILKGVFYPFKYILGSIYGIFHLQGFLGSRDRKKLISRYNKGLLIDAKKGLRLSEEHSFQNLLIHATTGLGKTTSMIIPMILDKANHKKNSMFILDPKGEICSITGGYLQRKGYEVVVLDPNNLDISIGFNPLEFAKNSADIEHIMRSLLYSSSNGSSGAQDRFWNESAVALLTLIGNLLLAIGDKQYMNLANVKYLLSSFSSQTNNEMDNVVIKYGDADLIMEYRQFKAYDDTVKLSVLATANMALSSIANNDALKRIMASPSYDLKQMRTKKVALFLSIPVQSASQYSFLVSSFISSLMYNALLNKIPTKQENSVYMFLDEIGSFKINDLDKYITVTRAYKISEILAIQSVNQVEHLYGKAAAETILNGGIGSKIFFGGANNNLAQQISSMIGKKQTLIQGRVTQQDVMQASEVRTLKNGEVLVFIQNNKPFKQKLTPYFKLSKFKRATKIKFHPSMVAHIVDYVKYIDLRSI